MRNSPVKRLHTHEACAIGATINAGLAVGMFKDEKDAVNRMTKISEVFHPIQQNVDAYEDIFNNVYKKMYTSGKGIFETLSQYE